MGTLLGLAGMIGFAVWLLKKDEWASSNRLPPPGMKKDWGKANTDIITKGKRYYYQQDLAGKYDIPDDK